MKRRLVCDPLGAALRVFGFADRNRRVKAHLLFGAACDPLTLRFRSAITEDDGRLRWEHLPVGELGAG